MQSFIIIFIIIIVAVAVFIALRKKTAGTELLPYEKKKGLLTPTKLFFYRILKQVIGDQYQIFGQVRVADILAVKKDTNNSKRQTYLNKIKSKHVDFVLCNPGNLHIVAVIELDNKFHQEPKRIEQDKFLNEAFQVAGIPLIRFKVKKSYSFDEIVKSLQNSIEFNEGQLAMSLINKAMEQEEPDEATVALTSKSEAAPETRNQDEKMCPKCSSPMVRKKSNKGKNAGDIFLICPNFPACRTAFPVDEISKEQGNS